MSKKLEKTKEQFLFIDLAVSKNANNDEYERYEASLPIISKEFLFNEIGKWNGRESLIKGQESENEWVRINFWVVLASKKQEATEKIEKIIKNFELSTFTQLKIRDNLHTQDKGEDIASDLQKQKKLQWVWYK